jgi:radical SAM protein with 4Fe4S-binding SPASM domain
MKDETGTQFNLDSTWDVFKAFLKRGRGKYLSFLYNRFAWDHYHKWHKITNFPLNIDIEACSICNIQCTHCFRQYLDIKDEETFMDMDLYEKIVEECARESVFTTFKFSMRGEPCMHPQIVEMVDLAKRKGIKEIWINTNGKNMTEEMFRGFMKAKLDILSFSVDGLGEIYEKVRVPLKFEQIYQNIKMVRRLRDEAKSNRPMLKVQSIYSAIEDNPKAYLDTFNPLVDKISFNAVLDYKDFNVVPNPEFCCARPWQRLSVTANGDVLRCPSDFLKEDVLGNVKDQSIKSIWLGKRMTELRQIHIDHRHTVDPVCAKCNLGTKMVESKIDQKDFNKNMSVLVFKDEKQPSYIEK